MIATLRQAACWLRQRLGGPQRSLDNWPDATRIIGFCLLMLRLCWLLCRFCGLMLRIAHLYAVRYPIRYLQLYVLVYVRCYCRFYLRRYLYLYLRLYLHLYLRMYPRLYWRHLVHLSYRSYLTLFEFVLAIGRQTQPRSQPSATARGPCKSPSRSPRRSRQLWCLPLRAKCNMQCETGQHFTSPIRAHARWRTRLRNGDPAGVRSSRDILNCTDLVLRRPDGDRTMNHNPECHSLKSDSPERVGLESDFPERDSGKSGTPDLHSQPTIRRAKACDASAEVRP
jgi:hypothetical protein